jgi:hypothetical protein
MSRLCVCLFGLVLCTGIACDPDDTDNDDMNVLIITAPDMPDDMTLDMPEDLPDLAHDLSAPDDMPVMVEPDMPEEPDLEPDMPEEGLPSSCDEGCKVQDLTITFGEEVRPIGRAIYGFSVPEADGEPWTLYMEMLEGELQACPEGPSSPKHTLIMSGVPIFEDELPVDKQSFPDLNAVLFEFEEDLLPDPPFRTRAESITVSARALSVCVECVGMPAPSDPDGFMAITMSATFPEGEIAGDVYAVHCDSLDRPAVQ